MPTANYAKLREKTIEIAQLLNVQREEENAELVSIIDSSHVQSHFATKIFPLNWSSRFATLLYSSPNATNLYTNDIIAFSDFFLFNWVALNGQHR